MKEELLKEFEKEFVFSGDFGEKRLSIFRVNNWSEKDPIINDEDIVIDLEKFLQKAISETEKETRLKTLEWVEDLARTRSDGERYVLIDTPEFQSLIKELKSK